MGFILKFLAPFMPYIVCFLIASNTIFALMLSISNTKYDNLVIDAATKIERAEANVVKLENSVNDLNDEIKVLVADQAAQKVRREFRDTQLAELQNSLNEERRKNESYKTRWSNVANKRPTLLARIVNRATAARVRFFAFTTCRTNCDRDRDSENSSTTTPETRPDSGN